ncbi:hypothetical protein [Corynebacterium meridianum]|uniref:Uncharacterized protein n=1 Tax=Corynebacterium meridianum TaxID=2765363 RepID=A0A934I5I6_9CORY|nr:hypothetical protein [Corynebacterium meridianum]MBI8988742.1 hypothetical protein [Corynebacterium meridianum]MCK7677213.1 hypothetical protein [Corynebacterium meridianum]
MRQWKGRDSVESRGDSGRSVSTQAAAESAEATPAIQQASSDGDGGSGIVAVWAAAFAMGVLVLAATALRVSRRRR